MKSTTSFFWQFHLLFFCFTLLAFGVSYFAFSGHWVAGFLMMGVPVCMFIHLILCVFWLFYKPRKVWLSALALLLSFPFWSRTWQLPTFGSDPPKEDNQLTVLSYNVMSFDGYNFIKGTNPQNALDFIDWTKKQDADIKCFQEFYNSDSRPHLNTLQQIKNAGTPYYTVLHPAMAKREQHCFGLGIMSKYPIVNRGEIVFYNQNGLLFADIKIKKDTIRVINLHLRSMIMRFNGLKEAYKEIDYGQGKSETRKVFEKLKMGFVHHADETQVLLEWIEQSPHPVLVCGDFNETPYGYAYGQVRKRLSNAFEEVGSGFGFSYRNTPSFIRIDNQFFDKKKLEVIDFQTRRDLKFSDHYPIIGRYRLL